MPKYDLILDLMSNMWKNILSGTISVLVLAGMLGGVIYGIIYFVNNGDTEIKLPKNMSVTEENSKENNNLAGQETPAVKNNENMSDKVQVGVLKEGSGVAAKTGDTVAVHYVGTLTDGTKFDSSVDRGQPFSFKLGARAVIAGWEIGVNGMKVGEVRRLIIPPQFGYGEAGTPGGPIPPNATLLFEVQLLKIN